MRLNRFRKNIKRAKKINIKKEEKKDEKPNEKS